MPKWRKPRGISGGGTQRPKIPPPEIARAARNFDLPALGEVI